MTQCEGIYDTVRVEGLGTMEFEEGQLGHCDLVVASFDCGGETPPPRGVGCERLQML